jgi:photosystem II stability/assembly factor-like uncharacterized protein
MNTFRSGKSLKKTVRSLWLVGGLMALGFSVQGQDWNLSDAPNLSWISMAGSLNGSNLVAASYDGTEGGGGFIYISTDGGQTWNPTSAPDNNNWYSVAASSDGVRLVAGAYQDSDGNPGPICLSTNEGLTWQMSSAPSNSWQTVVSSTNGQVLVGAAYNGGIYVSTNSGTDWNLAANAPTNNSWNSLATSADGSKIYATYNGGIYVSTNTGATWNLADTTNAFWYPIACSQDGGIVFAGINGGGLYASTNSGATWSLNYDVSLNWQCLTMSTNGSTLLAGAVSDSLYLSTNSGASWNPQNTSPILPTSPYWDCVFCSANGGWLVAGAYGDYIYFAAPPPVPMLNIQTVANRAVISWPVSATGFQLQTIGALQPAATWTNILAGITQIGTNYFYTNSLTLPGAFFRLAKP